MLKITSEMLFKIYHLLETEIKSNNNKSNNKSSNNKISCLTHLNLFKSLEVSWILIPKIYILMTILSWKIIIINLYKILKII